MQPSRCNNSTNDRHMAAFCQWTFCERNPPKPIFTAQPRRSSIATRRAITLATPNSGSSNMLIGRCTSPEIAGS